MLAQNLLSTSQMSTQQNIKIYFLINTINIATIVAIIYTKLSFKLVPRFNKKCKKFR